MSDKFKLFLIGWLLCGLLNLYMISIIKPYNPISLTMATALVSSGGIGLAMNSIAAAIFYSPCVINCKAKE